jgi:aerobic-type carbon monoxide dehydrogenase small subunit (CoxS/CutS family)
MSIVQFKLNGRPVKLDTDVDRMLLWVLRNDLALTGTKYGCGEGICGACTVVVRITVILVANNELAPQGCGEPAITTAGAVIANAVFDATGACMLRLPMTPQRIAAAIPAADR